MTVFRSRIDPASDGFRRNRADMLELVGRMRELEAQACTRSDAAAARFHRRGQLLPRERLALLLDPGAPVLELGNVAGYDPEGNGTVPGGGMITLIGFIAGTRCLVIANDSGIDAGSLTTPGSEKLIRACEIGLENRLPVVFLVESAGGNLLTYRVEFWHRAGRMFAMQAKLSAAGIPVITVQHGSGTAGGAYFPGMSDIVIGVKGRGFAFLAGPPLLKAATGEIADAEELGGMSMHARVSGLVEHLAEDDEDALRICRDVVARLRWNAGQPSTGGAFEDPAYDPDELAGVVPVDVKKPYDCREVIARIADGSDLLEFKPDFGAMTVCVEGTVLGHPAGFIANNGAIDVEGAAKATHFMQRCTQLGVPLVFLQNITGYMVGVASERSGMIKNGAKMIQAVATTSVPKFTLIIGASFGAGNYGMCGAGYWPRLIMCWPNARLGVLGAEQAAQTMRMVAAEKAVRDGEPLDDAALDKYAADIAAYYDAQESAFVSSGRMCDDGLLDPRHSRHMLGFSLAMAAESQLTETHPLSFSVARM
ncbi:MAG TPA: carboxyl transferase domain-containing protein [Solirubrobacteraceae bacterium]|jgi:geranyl-CoA carboxylase beta subunit|nr:carboxyl transferase domain-containing protein [Solirubrobacteraceae bacterium]